MLTTTPNMQEIGVKATSRATTTADHHPQFATPYHVMFDSAVDMSARRYSEEDQPIPLLSPLHAVVAGSHYEEQDHRVQF